MISNTYSLRIALPIDALSLQTGEVGYIFPLYIYDKQGGKTFNFNEEIIHKIEEIVGIAEPREVFNYVYAILHSPTYREKYKEFFKINFLESPILKIERLLID